MADPAGPPLLSLVVDLRDRSELTRLDRILAAPGVRTPAVEVVLTVMSDDAGARSAGRAWAERSPSAVVVDAHPCDVGEARNASLAACNGAWIAFVDPADQTPPGWVEVVSRVLAEEPTAALVRVRPTEASAERPARLDAVGRRRPVDLRVEPEHFPVTIAGCFFRRDLIERTQTRFDPRVRPHFCDLHFVANYLARAPSPTVLVLRDVELATPRTARERSTERMSDAGHYTAVLEHGYLGLLQQSGTTGGPPMWIQYLVLHELSSYFAEEERFARSASALDAPTANEFHRLMREIVAHLSEHAVRSYTSGTLSASWRAMILHGWSDQAWHTPHATLAGNDHIRRLVRLRYWYCGAAPTERILADGRTVTPVHAKHRVLHYFARDIMRERIAWVRADADLAIELDGRRVPLRSGRPAPDRMFLPAGMLQSRFLAGPIERQPDGSGPAAERASGPAGRARRGVGDDRRRFRDRRRSSRRPGRRDVDASIETVRSRAVGADFTEAWVFVDRLTDANDNAEALFDHVRATRPAINAWFVLQDTTDDWARLHRSRHGERLVAYGSGEWRELMQRCVVLISSHGGRDLLGRSVAPQAHRVFLQHGVMQRDLSTWLNPREVDLFVTTTEAEHDSIVGDETGFTYTTREVVRCEMPRLDRLLSTAAVEEPGLLLLAPTWREWLVGSFDTTSRRRSTVADFATSEFWRNWGALLGSPQLIDLADRAGLTVAFMPHPNQRDVESLVDIPSHVHYIDGPNYPVYRALAQTAVLVTDYSSVAFDVAYLGRPSVYFQFDRDRMERGHIGRAGYFDFDEHGFGPVASDVASALDAVASIVDAMPVMPPPFAERTRAAFTYRDGRACERVAAAIDELVGGPASAH